MQILFDFYFSSLYILSLAGWSSLVAQLAHNQQVACSNHVPATMRKQKLLQQVVDCDAKMSPQEELYKVKFYINDPETSRTIVIEQEWRGDPEYLARHFYTGGVMENSNWYNPNTIFKMHFGQPLKKDSLMQKTPPPSRNVDPEPEDKRSDINLPSGKKNDISNVPFQFCNSGYI